MTDTTLLSERVTSAEAQESDTTTSLTKTFDPELRVAVVHDYLTQRGGAERVVLSMLKAFPGAPLHTSLYHPAGTFPEFEHASVSTFNLDRSSVLRKHHRLALPFLASSFGRHHVEADVVICSSSGWAHGTAVSGRKIVYCYSPARWLYDGQRYLGRRHGALSRIAAGIRPPLMRWDQRAAASADRYLTLSSAVKEKIKAIYGIDAEVLHPPPTLTSFGPRTAVSGLDSGFFLCVSRLLPYKNVDAIVDAFTSIPQEQLVVVGAGPERGRIESLGVPNVRFLGSVSDSQLRWLYAASVGVVAASYEDYGLTPLEGAAFGKPAVVLRKGGFLETVVERRTGIFFDEPDPHQIAQALRTALDAEWPAAELHDHARAFSEESFVRRLREITAEEAVR
ncbi:MAG: glycosyltransferase [Actinomycetota bacterium]|nr:glycosyltransferase [Actinomycetota bacterium]